MGAGAERTVHLWLPRGAEASTTVGGFVGRTPVFPALPCHVLEREREIFPNPCTMAPGFASLPLLLLPLFLYISSHLIVSGLPSTQLLHASPTSPSPFPYSTRDWKSHARIRFQAYSTIDRFCIHHFFRSTRFLYSNSSRIIICC